MKASVSKLLNALVSYSDCALHIVVDLCDCHIYNNSVDYPCRDGSCPRDYNCEVNPNSRQPMCKRSHYGKALCDGCMQIIIPSFFSVHIVPCTADVLLTCDSNFLRCVVENTTRHASCLPSCYLNNGNCDYDQTCVVDVTEIGSTVHCLNRDG